MKKLTLAVLFMYGLSCIGQNAAPVNVTTQSINITGTLAAASWKSDHQNQPYPNYPKMYYGFAEGDEIVIDFSTDNKKGTQLVEISEFESKSVVYSNRQFQTLEGVHIRVPKTAVYKFEFATNHIFDRQAKVIISRIPASEATRNFNCNVTWRKVIDTIFNVVEQKRKTNVSYEAVTIQSPMDLYVNSATYFGQGKTRLYQQVTLPENTVEWYYTFGASRNKADIEATKSRMKLFSELAGLLDQSGIVSLGINALSQPPGADYCDVYLIKPEHLQAFRNKQDNLWSAIPEGTKENIKSGVVRIKNCCKTNTFFLGFKNPALKDGVSILYEIVAIVEKANYETVQIKQPVSYATHNVPVFGN